jgi:hypothetical protein
MSRRPNSSIARATIRRMASSSRNIGGHCDGSAVAGSNFAHRLVYVAGQAVSGFLALGGDHDRGALGS